jgi:hypothetical protein
VRLSAAISHDKTTSCSSTVQGGEKRRSVTATLDARSAISPLWPHREQQHQAQCQRSPQHQHTLCALSKIDFEIIENAFNALLQSHPDPVTADKIADLQNMFRDAFTGWLEIEKEAA